MNQILRSLVIVVGLFFTLGGGVSRADPPPNNDISAQGNTAGGTEALALNTTGINNTAFGYRVLWEGLTPSLPTGGASALQYTFGSNNTANGFAALHGQARNFGGDDNNTAIGAWTLLNN